MYRGRFWPTIAVTDLKCAGNYFFGGGRIEISRKQGWWQFTITLLHELTHWLLDTFHASYYKHIAFDIFSERWFPMCENRSAEFIRHDKRQLAALRHLGFEKCNIRDLWMGTKWTAFNKCVFRGRT
jgi:hypothetical protein